MVLEPFLISAGLRRSPFILLRLLGWPRSWQKGPCPKLGRRCPAPLALGWPSPTMTILLRYHGTIDPGGEKPGQCCGPVAPST